jgi:anti-sigma regulatory factor (Ser/Thr protein kinase)
LVLANEVIVEVEDQGLGFNPCHVPNPLIKERLGGTIGRGLFLMQAYTSWLRFNSWGNRVTMCRRRSVTSTTDSKP